MIILYHNAKIGGDLLNTTANYFELLGSKKLVTSFKCKPASILKINEVENSSWDTLKTQNKRGSRNQKGHEPYHHVLHQRNDNPPFLTKSPMVLKAPTVEDMFVETLKISANFDKNKEE